MPDRRKRDAGDELDDVIRRFEAGEQVWSEDDEEVHLEFKQPLDKIVPVRLTSDRWSALYREAHELGIGPSTLARMWILEKLRSLAAERRPRKRTTTSAAKAPPAKKRRSA